MWGMFLLEFQLASAQHASTSQMWSDDAQLREALSCSYPPKLAVRNPNGQLE